MLRRLLKLPFFSFATPISKKYFIKSHAFLVEEKPQKPPAPYTRFYHDQTVNMDQAKISIQFLQQLRKRWQNSPDVKKKYDDEYNALQQQYKKNQDAWEANFDVPFKKLSFLTQFVKKIHHQGLVLPSTNGIKDYGKRSAELMKIITPEERLEIENNVQRIREEREKTQEKYKFPVRLYDTQKSYDMKNIQPKAKHTEAVKKKMQAGYEDYVKQWKSEVESWLKVNNFNITIEEFVKMYEQCLIKKATKKEPVKIDEAQNEQVKVESKPAPIPEQVKLPV